jgi:ABC-type Fe3+-siderophore transport system permease subunit
VLVGAVIDEIMALPPRQRIATYPCRVERWTGPEIAELLSIEPSTVYAHIHEGTHRVNAATNDKSVSRTRLAKVVAFIVCGAGLAVSVATRVGAPHRPYHPSCPSPAAGEGMAAAAAVGVSGGVALICCLLLVLGVAMLVHVRRQARNSKTHTVANVELTGSDCWTRGS